MSVDAALDLVRPTFFSGPELEATDGDLVGQLCRNVAGFVPDPEQQLILDYIFGVGPSGRPAVFDTTIIAPRQNLKTGALKMAALGFLLVTEDDLVVWSAHEFRTAQEAFRDFTILFESSPDLDAEVQAIHRANGDEAIELKSGCRLMFKARTKAGGRGLTGDKVILDEAFALQPEHLGALLPTMLARPFGQVVYASSAGMVSSHELRELRDAGRGAGGPRSAYFEWCDDRPNVCAVDGCDHRRDAAGCALDDPSRWRHMSALGRRIDEEAVLSLRAKMPPEEFARELMGWWDEPVESDDATTLAEWLAAKTTAAPQGRLVFAVDVAPAHTHASVVVCGDGVLEVVDRRRGASWLPERLAELAARHGVDEFVIDPAGPIGSLIPDFERAGVPLLMLSGRDSVNACTAIEVAIREGDVKHRGEPELLNAVGGAKRRKVGEGWKWTRVDSTVDISPLVAATYAHWGALAHANEPIDPVIRFV